MKKRFILILIIITIFILSVIVSKPLGLNINGAIVSVEKRPIILLAFLLAFLFQLVGHLVRSHKHKILLQQIRPIKIIDIFKGQTIGFLFNTILPLRIGELMRAHYIGKSASISRSAVFATILFERLLDIIVMILICMVLIFRFNVNNNIVVALMFALTVIAIFLAFFLYVARSQKYWFLKFIYHATEVFNHRLRDRLRLMTWSAIYALKNTINRCIIVNYLAETIIMWLFYFSSTFIFVVIVFNSLDLIGLISTALSPYLGVSIPSGPAYLGSFQNILSSVSTVSIDMLHSDNITVSMWIILMVPTTVLGLAFLACPQKIYRNKDSSLITSLKNKLYRDIDITDEFSQFLDAYFNCNKINRVLATQELNKNFQVIKTFTGGSNALTALVCQNNRLVVKKITLKQYQDKLESQYDWLRRYDGLSQIAKAIKQYEDDNDFYAIDIEYRDDYIPFFDFIHSCSDAESWALLQKICKFMSKEIYKPAKLTQKSGLILVDEYIKSKVIDKITDSANISISISNLLSYEYIVINGNRVLNFNSIIDKIIKNSRAMTDLSTIIETPIHGDLTIDNIIVNPKDKDFVIIDPNNENVISDAVVDYGKLMQSIHSGYEFVRMLASCEIKNNSINFREAKSSQYEKLYSRLQNYLSKTLTVERYHTILFHEAVHYCRMLTYRCDINPDTAAVFYAIAVRLFNDFLEQYENQQN